MEIIILSVKAYDKKMCDLHHTSWLYNCLYTTDLMAIHMNWFLKLKKIVAMIMIDYIFCTLLGHGVFGIT